MNLVLTEALVPITEPLTLCSASSSRTAESVTQRLLHSASRLYHKEQDSYYYPNRHSAPTNTEGKGEGRLFGYLSMKTAIEVIILFF